MSVAAIDIGTNTLLLLLARRGAGGAIEAVEDQVRFGRLGRGLDRSGRLDAGSIEVSLEALRDYRRLMDRHQVSEVRAVGTQALREADNSADFTGPAEDILGAAIEIITGEREAELVSTAVREQFPDLGGGDVTIADIGGGSTEVIVASGGELSWYRSVPVGSVRMSERHLQGDPPTPEQTSAAAGDIDAQLGELDLPRGGVLVATAGTATTVASVALKLRGYSRRRVHGHRMEPGEVDRVVANLLGASVQERRRMTGMEPERADVIGGGALVLSRLIAATRPQQIVVADAGVRWGLVHEMLGGRGAAR